MRTHIVLGVAIAVAALTVLSGCGSDRGPQSKGTTTTTKTTTATTTKSPTETTNTSGAQFEIGETINYGSMDTTETVDCGQGKSLNVGGSNNKLTVTGVCTDVTVIGSGNTVTVNQVDKSIKAFGMNNKITYKAGEPQIDKLGDSNEITKG